MGMDQNLWTATSWEDDPSPAMSCYENQVVHHEPSLRLQQIHHVNVAKDIFLGDPIWTPQVVLVKNWCPFQWIQVDLESHLQSHEKSHLQSDQWLVATPQLPDPALPRYGVASLQPQGLGAQTWHVVYPEIHWVTEYNIWVPSGKLT